MKSWDVLDVNHDDDNVGPNPMSSLVFIETSNQHLI